MSGSERFDRFVDAFPKNAAVAEQVAALLEGAIRAPSTHNSQPWKFRMEGDSLQVSRDESVVLPNSDKDTQYAHISIGFLLHHIETLGKFLGIAPAIEVAVDGPSIARIRFAPSTGFVESERDLARAIFARRNRRGVFEKDSMPPDLVARFRDPVPLPPGLPETELAISTDPVVLARIGAGTLETMVRLYGRKSFRTEMSRWIVPSNSRRKTGIPGYSLNMPLPLSMVLPTIIRTFNIGKLPGKLSAEAIASAPAVFGFGTDADPAAWVSVGYRASSIILALVERGLDASVYVATAELPDIREGVMRDLGLAKQLRFLFVAGKLTGSAEWITPRVPLPDKLLA